MKDKSLKEVSLHLEREIGSMDVDDEDMIGENDTNHFKCVMHMLTERSGDETSQTMINTIRSFENEDEIHKHKLQSFCLDFYDPTVEEVQEEKGEEVCLHAYLKQDELYVLFQFVKRHQNDMSFGEMVYKIMDKHEMTAPQVYKNALLRRQDFARVTDPRCKNVTRKMAWQIVIGLHCSLKEADEVLFSAGYIRRNTRMDLTMQYFIEQKNYDIEAIDSVLEELGLKTFTCD